VIWLLTLLACSSAGLEFIPEPEPTPPDDRLAISGEYCTSSTDDLRFPLHVLFVVDSSESMRLTDPPDPVSGQTGRERAVDAAATRLLSDSADTRVGVIRFSAQAQSITLHDAPDGSPAYFTDDLTLLRSRLPLLSATDRTTNYRSAMAEAYSEIRGVLEEMDASVHPRTSWQVVFVTDGLPDEQSGGLQEVFETVENLARLESIWGVADLSLSTVLLRTGAVEVDLAAEDLLRSMAETGGGTFRSYASGADLSFLDLETSALRRMYTLDSLVALNLNAIPTANGPVLDADGDQVSDALEIELGTNPHHPDSDLDGCGDHTEVRFLGNGLDPLDPSDCRCDEPEWCFDVNEDGACDNGCVDTDGDNLCDCSDVDEDGECDDVTQLDVDGDGLVDCEERWAGTNNRSADTDLDDRIDTHELRFGTRADVADAVDDLDWDRIDNGSELAAGTHPTADESADRSERAYRYAIEDRGIEPGRACYDFTVSNIQLLPVSAAEPSEGPLGSGFSGSNRVLLLAGEVPVDAHTAPAAYAVACVEARFDPVDNRRNPPSGQLRVSRDDFVPLSSFDAAEHCRGPAE